MKGDFAQLLSALRKHKNLTRRDLAILTDLSEETIKQFENGRKPSMNSLAKICKGLDLDFEDYEQYL